MHPMGPSKVEKLHDTHRIGTALMDMIATMMNHKDTE